MPRPSKPKPVEPAKPKPEDFGLNAKRVCKFKEREEPGCLAVASFVGIYLVAYLITIHMVFAGSIAAGMFLIINVGCLIAVGLLSCLFFAVAKAAWKALQPDVGAYERYQAAEKSYRESLADYAKDLALWYRTQEEWWRSLSGPRFEREIGRLLQDRGYHVQFTGASGDGGVDLLLLGPRGQTVLVQCKAHKQPIGPGPVRDLFGTLTHRGVTEAWLISTAGFTSGARDFAKDKPIRLTSIREILQEDI